MGVQRIARVLPCIVCALLASGSHAMEAALQRVHDEIVEDYPRVVHLDASRLLELPREGVILFDVRDPEEFAVSRLDGAIRVDVDVEEGSFLAQHGAALQGRNVVFYCSVGRRSSMLADRLYTSLHATGASAVANLTGGIFEWRNAGHPLVDDGGATPFVHPYDAFWGRLVEDQAFVRYEVADAP
jgi:rhodanese-related sulfurtransferase